MRLSPGWIALSLSMLCALVVTTAQAHEYWLAPRTTHAGAGDTVGVRAFVGTGFRGELKPYAAPRAVRFEVRHARTLDLKQVALNGADEWARFVLPDEGGAAVTYLGNDAFIELPAPEFDAYLKLEGLDGPRAARLKRGAAAGPGRERYSRCAKLWIAGSDPARILAPFGVPFEIVPLADPLAGAKLPVRVLLRGQPLAHALVRAWNRPLDPKGRPFDPMTRDSVPMIFQARTNEEGRVTVPVDRPGEWLINCVVMEPSDTPAEADWRSQWASFTFARPARKTRRP